MVLRILGKSFKPMIADSRAYGVTSYCRRLPVGWTTRRSKVLRKAARNGASILAHDRDLARVARVMGIRLESGSLAENLT